MRSRRVQTAFVLAAAFAVSCGSSVAPPVAPSTAPTRAVGTPSPPPAGGPIPAEKLTGRIVWSSEVLGAATDVFTAAVEGGRIGAPSRLTNGPVAEFDADLSPDGRSVVFRSNPQPRSDHADLWAMDASGGPARNLTGSPELDNWSPAWSPDGRRIAFASTRGGALSVWTMRRDGTDLRRVTREHGEYPDWSPDGAAIVYAAPPGGRGAYDLWRIAADGTGTPVRITTAPGTDFAPAWSPDGRWIAYQTEIADRWELWIVRPDGTDAHRVSPNGEDGVWPAWTPTGLLAWSGPHGISLLDLNDGRRATIAMPDAGGPEFLSWGMLADGS